MNQKLACLALTTALLTACGQSDVPVQPIATPAEEVVVPLAEAPEIIQGDAVLIDGYVPTFPHKVRSMRDEGSSHFVVLEYLGMHRDAAIANMSDSLRAKGFRITGPQPREAAVQYLYINADGRRMSAIFSDPSSKPLAHPDAQGIAMFSWADATSN